MNFSKKSALIFCASIIGLNSFSQDGGGSSYSLSEGWGIGVEGGFPMGIGGYVSKGFSEKTILRLGFNTLKYGIPESIDVFGSTEASISFERVYLGADFHPGGKMFSIGLGGMINNLNAGATFVSNTSITVIDKNTNTPVTVSPSDLGKTEATIEPVSKIAPYFTVGYGRSLPKNFIGLRIELGVIYMGEVETSYSDATIISAGQTVVFDPSDVPQIKSEIEDVNNKLAKYSLLPFINLQLTLKIK